MDKQIKVQNPPIVDLTSIVGIESIFNQGRKDPSGPEIAGHFADLFIWYDQIRYILPIPSDREPHIPPLFECLLSREQKVLEPKEYIVSDRPMLDSEYLEGFFQDFYSRIRDKRRKRWFRQWIALHDEPWIRSDHNKWIGRDYFYNIEHLESLAVFKEAVSKMRMDRDKLKYAFDVALRYPYYGELAGEGAFYLAHPIRSGQNFSEYDKKEGPESQIPLTFKEIAKELVTKMTRDEFAVFLHNARHLVRHHKLIGKKRGEVDRETCREIARKLQLPARLKQTTTVKIIGTTTGVMTLLTVTTPIIAPIVLGVVTVAAVFWKGSVPRLVSKIHWLFPYIEWDLEGQARNHKYIVAI